MEDIIINAQTVPAQDYAGFWRRFAAWLIDFTIFGVLFLPFTFLFLRNSGLWNFIVISNKLPKDSMGLISTLDPAYSLLLQNVFREITWFMLIQFVFAVFYFAVWESSKFRATPGKLAARITVANLNGNRLSFLRALGRNFCKIFSSFIFMIGYLFAGITERKQALHDMMAGCIVTKEAAHEPAATFAYAGFWLRFLAFILDWLLLYILLSPINIFLMPSVKNNPLQIFFKNMSAHSPAQLPDINVLIRILSVSALTGFITFFYFASWESSRFQATPGKMAIGIKVIDLNGNRLSFWRAAGRYVCKFVSNFTLFIGYMMAGWTKHKQALHDKLNHCLVIKQQ